MDLQLIGQDAAAARVAYRQYRQLRMKSEEDDQIMRAYRAAAKGTPLIKLSEAIELGGFDRLGRPMLAIARADAQWCWLDRWRNRLTFRGKNPRARGRTPQGLREELTIPSWPEHNSGVWISLAARAMVPVIPAHLRPAHGLHNYHILWEADWQAVPKDPALLKHLGGDLYAVLAVWDLTEIERAVLAGRRPE